MNNQNSYEYPHDLFVDETGNPLVFTIPYYPERSQISKLIKVK